MVELRVWLCAGKVARRLPATPPARLLAMRARRDGLVSISGMGDPLLVPGLPTAGSADRRPSTPRRTGTAKRTGAVEIDFYPRRLRKARRNARRRPSRFT